MESGEDDRGSDNGKSQSCEAFVDSSITGDEECMPFRTSIL